ncbi:hypothetical protein GCM10022252_28620 [Streptosporangium oxazolinicum]|uniref:Uncharacterized protein n=1 Tax=Streptosporangium oxazolinicum TaxID=909287 RepID=A0ABP8AUG4_9ACTN
MVPDRVGDHYVDSHIAAVSAAESQNVAGESRFRTPPLLPLQAHGVTPPSTHTSHHATLALDPTGDTCPHLVDGFAIDTTMAWRHVPESVIGTTAA